MQTEFNKLLISAYDDFQKGNLDNAELKLEGLMNKEPGNIDVLFMLGVIYGINKRHYDEKSLFEKIIKKQPNNGIVNFNLAKACSELGQDFESLKYHKKAITINTNNIEAWLNYGNSLSKLKEYQASVSCYENALKINSKSIEALVNKSIALSNLEKFTEAISVIDAALKLKPESPPIFFTKGIILLKNKNFEDAISCFDRSINLDSDNIDAILHRGLAYQGAGRFIEAIVDFDKTIEHESKKIISLINKAVSLFHLNYIDSAKLLLTDAIGLHPDNADAHYNLALILLSQFDFESGWIEYESRFEASSFATKKLFTNIKKWDGNKKINKLLVWSEQGIGDQLLYLTMLRDIDFDLARITLLLPEKLSKIVGKSYPEVKLITSIKPNEMKKYDAHIPIGSLGALCRNSLESFRDKKTVLTSNSYASSKNDKFTSTLDPEAIKIGISWKSSNIDNGFAKNINLKSITSLAIKKNVNFINLQYGDVAKEITDSYSHNNVHIYNDEELDLYNNLEDLIVLISKCNIVITTSNTTAHLSGAIGKETLLLLPFAFGRYWYWSDINGISIWYPSIRIFRQKEQGNWEDPLKEIEEYLKNKYEY